MFVRPPDCLTPGAGLPAACHPPDSELWVHRVEAGPPLLPCLRWPPRSARLLEGPLVSPETRGLPRGMGIPHPWVSVGSRAINHRSAPINAVVSHRGPRRAPGRNSRNRRESTRPSARREGRGRGQCHVGGDLLSGPRERAWPGDLPALRNLSPGSAQPGLPPDALCWCLPGMVQCWSCREEAASVGHGCEPHAHTHIHTKHLWTRRARRPASRTNRRACAGTFQASTPGPLVFESEDTEAVRGSHLPSGARWPSLCAGAEWGPVLPPRRRLSSSLQPRIGCIILSPRQGRGRRCRESRNVPKSVKLLVGSSRMLFQAALAQESVLPRVLARASTRSWIP